MYYSKKDNFYVCTEYKKTKSNCPVTAKILEEELIITGGGPQPQLCPNNIYSSIDYIFIQYIANRNNLYVYVFDIYMINIENVSTIAIYSIYKKFGKL